MIKIYTLLITILLVNFTNKSYAQCGTNLLTNPGFDTPLQPLIGNNLTGLFTFGSWTMTVGPFNIIQTDGSVYGGGPNNAQNGTQYVDITGQAGTISQDFTVTGSGGSVAFGGYFSSRENGAYVPWVGNIEIYALPGNTLVAGGTSSSVSFVSTDGDVPAQETWKPVSGNVTLPAGNYRFVVNMGNYGNFDAAYVFQNCILPVSLNNFTANYQNSNVTLNWKLATNTLNTNCTVERSVNGINFSNLSQLNSSSNSYNYTDNNITDNTTYFYRIKISEANGANTYSTILKVFTGKSKGISIGQNPVTTMLSIGGLQGKGYVNIVDASGKVVTKQNIIAQNMTINTNKLTPGVYLIQEVDEVIISTKRFIKN
jgi:Secretion system C-terminal sorting domain